MVLTTIAHRHAEGLRHRPDDDRRPFDTSVVANEFYSQSFRSDNQGLGAALAVLLFILVIPIVVYNVRQLRASEAR